MSDRLAVSKALAVITDALFRVNWMTPDEAARELGCTKSRVHQLIKSGVLPAEKILHRLAIAEADVRAYLAKRNAFLGAHPALVEAIDRQRKVTKTTNGDE